MAVTFKKAERKQAKCRVAITGPSGSGKTYGALLIAKGMGGKVAVIDTERGSASLYSDLTDFDTLELNPPYTPEAFIEAIHAAEKAGYDTLIIDSMTHEWDGSGGCLEINDNMANAKFKGNTWAAWSETTPRHRAFVDAILQSPCHIIATMRSKTDTVQGDGKKVIKLGLKTVQRDGMDYEFTTVLDLTHENKFATASKDRTGLFKESAVITSATGKKLLDWLNSGAVVASQPVPPPAVNSGHTQTQVSESYKSCREALETAKALPELQKAWAYTLAEEKAGAITKQQLDSLIPVKDAAKARLTNTPQGA